MHTSNIISKHINHKVFSSFIFILLTMVGILFISRSVGYFEKSVAGQLDPNIILNILMLRLPDFLSFLIPFSIFISLYLNFSNQYSSNEIYAIFNTGTSRLSIVSSLNKQLILILISVLILSVFIGPATKQMSEEIQEFTSFEKKLLQLQPKTLNSVPGSAGKIYFDSMNQDGFTDVIFIEPNGSDISIIQSKKMEVLGNEADNLELKFYSGLMSSTLKSGDSFEITFNEFIHPIYQDNNISSVFSFRKVFDFDQSDNFINLQWRISLVIMTLSLIYFAFILAPFSPRASVSAQFVPGLLIYILYLASLIFYRDTFSDDSKVLYYGLWPVHFTYILLITIYSKSNYFQSLVAQTSKRQIFLMAIILALMTYWIAG